MKPRIWKVWKVRVASGGCPTVYRDYFIEHRGQGKIVNKKALKLAAEDGLTSPVVTGAEWVSRPTPR